MGDTFREQWAAVSAFLDFENAGTEQFEVITALEQEAAAAGWRDTLEKLLEETPGGVSPRLELIARAAATILEAKKQRSRDRFSSRDAQVISAAVYQLLVISIKAEKRSRRAGAIAVNTARQAEKVKEYLEVRKGKNTRRGALEAIERAHTTVVEGEEKTERGYTYGNLNRRIPSDKKLGLEK